jgi:predicted DNA-binding protein (MmcQ/YjbR family)
MKIEQLINHCSSKKVVTQKFPFDDAPGDEIVNWIDDFYNLVF